MISFTLLVKDPATFKQTLVDQGIVTLDKNGVPVPARQGVEYVQVPNPIVGDGRLCFLVKFSGDALADQKTGAQLLDQYADTKLGAYVQANGVAGKIDGTDAWLVGTDFAILKDDTGRFGVWQ